MNARMYAVTPEVERGWQELLEHVADDAGVALSYFPYPAPQPLERAVARGRTWAWCSCAGIPIALRLAAGRADRRPDTAGRLGGGARACIAPI